MEDRHRRVAGWFTMTAGIATIGAGVAAGRGLLLAAGLTIAAAAAHLLGPRPP